MEIVMQTFVFVKMTFTSPSPTRICLVQIIQYLFSFIVKCIAKQYEYNSCEILQTKFLFFRIFFEQHALRHQFANIFVYLVSSKRVLRVEGDQGCCVANTKEKIVSVLTYHLYSCPFVSTFSVDMLDTDFDELYQQYNARYQLDTYNIKINDIFLVSIIIITKLFTSDCEQR